MVGITIMSLSLTHGRVASRLFMYRNYCKVFWHRICSEIVCSQSIASGAARRYAPRRWQFDGGKNRGGSTSVCGRVHSPQSLVAKLQAASVPVA